MEVRLLRYFVALADERNYGRAATRLHMTQPPLSRAIKDLESELGATLLSRSSTGLELTAAGVALYSQAKAILEMIEHVKPVVKAATGRPTILVGTLADSVAETGTQFANAFRQRCPGADVRIREGDLTDPTLGLRSGLVDVALTRTPFETTGIETITLQSDPVAVLLRQDDPLASRAEVRMDDLSERTLFRLPENVDETWRLYWNGNVAFSASSDAPVVRTVQECVQQVLWNGTIGLAPLQKNLPAGLAMVPVVDVPPTDLVIAWCPPGANPLTETFVRTATAIHRLTARSRANA